MRASFKEMSIKIVGQEDKLKIQIEMRAILLVRSKKKLLLEKSYSKNNLITKDKTTILSKKIGMKEVCTNNPNRTSLILRISIINSKSRETTNKINTIMEMNTTMKRGIT
jgi:hypothetical protein